MAAVFERAATQHRPPAFLIVDEFSDYADDNMESLLTQARKYHLGVLFAHQAMSQMSTSLQNIVAGNTSIKMAGGISDRDARAQAPDMRTTVDFLTDLKKTDRSAQFAAYIRNRTAHAVRIDVPFGLLEKEPRMTDEQYAVLTARNRARYSAEAKAAPEEATVNLISRPPEIESPRLDSAGKKERDDEDPKPSKDY
jgi:TraM recognition site of TraD and TraG